MLQACRLASYQSIRLATVRRNRDSMPAFTYQEIEFQISVREGFYYYERKVSPAYLVGGTGLDWAAIVVHRLPGRFRTDQWFVSEQTTGGAIEIPKTISRDEAAESAIDKIKALGPDGFRKALERTETQKERKWHNR